MSNLQVMKKFALILMLVCTHFLCFSQASCGFDWFLNQIKEGAIDFENSLIEFEDLINRFKFDSTRIQQRNQVVIPLVFHVVRHPSDRLISDEMIIAQIDRLNEDFAAQNFDVQRVPSEFKAYVGSATFRFCLAGTTSDENSSIIRKNTLKSQIGLSDDLYDDADGSKVWNPEHFVNIWIADTGNEITGFATFPGIVESRKQGIVIHPDFFGQNPSHRYALGRVLTHEMGHYFGLYHTWGIGSGCLTDDQIEDTPTQEVPYFGCPTHPQWSCESMDQFMNFMDYVDDECMWMFTKGQVLRMNSVRSIFRPMLGDQNSICAEYNSTNLTLIVYPNPGDGFIKMYLDNLTNPRIVELGVFDLSGKVIYSEKKLITDGMTLDISWLKPGLYLLKIGRQYYKYVKYL